MKSYMVQWLGLVLLVGYSLVQFGCSTDAQSKPQDDEEESVTVIPVEVGTVEQGDISAFFNGTATLEAEEEASVVAKASGVVQKILVEEGHYVKAGQVLAQLDSEQSSLEVAQLEVNLTKMKNDLDRNKELFDKELISAETYDQVRYQYEAQKASVDLARLKVNYASIKAPINGVISERMIKVGNMITMNQAAFQITDFNPLHAILHVPERELSKLRVGQVALLEVDALPGEVFKGRVERISPVVDPTTGTFKVTLAYRNPGARLKPGMLARVNVTYDVHENTMLLPKEAVVIEDAEASVFVVRNDTVHRTLVQTGYVDSQIIEILEGVNLGDVVVTTGQGTLRDSSHIEIIQ